MASNVAQHHIKLIEKQFRHGDDITEKMWSRQTHFKQEAEILHKKAKIEAIHQMSKILADTTERETLEKIQELCDSLIYELEMLLNGQISHSE